MKLLTGVVIYLLIILGLCVLEILSIIGMFGGSHVWTGVFGVITFLNVRALALATRKKI
jgi:hypothetical protein